MVCFPLWCNPKLINRDAADTFIQTVWCYALFVGQPPHHVSIVVWRRCLWNFLLFFFFIKFKHKQTHVGLKRYENTSVHGTSLAAWDSRCTLYTYWRGVAFPQPLLETADPVSCYTLENISLFWCVCVGVCVEESCESALPEQFNSEPRQIVNDQSHQRCLTGRTQEVAFQRGAEPSGRVLQITDDKGLHRCVLIIYWPGLTADTGTAVPGHVSHREAVLTERIHTDSDASSQIPENTQRAESTRMNLKKKYVLCDTLRYYHIKI